MPVCDPSGSVPYDITRPSGSSTEWIGMIGHATWAPNVPFDASTGTGRAPAASDAFAAPRITGPSGTLWAMAKLLSKPLESNGGGGTGWAVTVGDTADGTMIDTATIAPAPSTARARL